MRGRALSERGVAVNHILADGAIESHADAMTRAAREVGVSMQDLFCTERALLDEVYARRSAEIEYVAPHDWEELPRARRLRGVRCERHSDCVLDASDRTWAAR